jgi:hypothetical protein
MSTIFKDVGRLGTPHISTLNYKFGTSSGYFDGDGDYLTTNDHDDFAFGDGDFTIDFWLRTSDNTKSQIFYAQNNGTTDNSIYFYRTATNTVFYVKVSDSYIAYYYVTDTISNSTWYHYELVRNGSNIYIFRNGVNLTLTVTNAIGSQTIPNFTGAPVFCYATGYVDEFRISKGIARHTSDFTVPTQAYTYDSYTKLLLHFSGQQGSTIFLDNAFGQKLSHTAQVKILQYVEQKTSEVGTDEWSVKITNHGLEDGDFIVNTYWVGTEQNDTERGSRRVNVVDADNFHISQIVGQTSGEDIRLYHFTDISSYVDLNSINLNLAAEGNDTFSFTMSIPTDSTLGMETLPIEGQYIEFLIDGDNWFVGIISNTSRQLSNNIDSVTLTVSCMALKNRAYTRTVSVNYAAGTSSFDIVRDMFEYMIQEGSGEGTIDTDGINIDEAWTNDIITVGEVLDELAEKNGFFWYTTPDFELNFRTQRILQAYRDIVEGGEFTDFRDVVVNGNLADYRNKIFFVGGTDNDGRTVRNIVGDLTSQDYTQAICAGSGVYGEVVRNGSITTYTALSAEAGTNTTTVYLTGTNAVAGTYFLNTTRNLTGFVTSLHTNYFNCTSIAGQASGDTILFYANARILALNELKRMKNQPYELVFHTFDMTFKPQQRVYINIPSLNIDASYWNVESVQITDAGRGYFSQVVTCVLADDSNFSSQRRRNKDLDFFRRW